MSIGNGGWWDGMEMEKAGWLAGGSGRRSRDWLGGQMQETEQLRCVSRRSRITSQGPGPGPGTVPVPVPVPVAGPVQVQSQDMQGSISVVYCRYCRNCRGRGNEWLGLVRDGKD